MPYKSEKQRAYMHINHPKIAKKWDKKYGSKIEHGFYSHMDASKLKGKPIKGGGIQTRL